jgi:4-amino-4-deoxy-L-arabinose transferase-like glycosyltransferase
LTENYGSKPPSQLRAHFAAVFAAVTVIAICLFSHLGAFGLVGPDEPRYAWIARAMAQTGDWVTPRLYGSPWFEKPVLYYWAAALGFRLHLPAEWAARLPSAFAALAAAIAISWLAWKHHAPGDNLSVEKASGAFTASPGLLASLIFSTSVAAIGFARAATPDMLFSASLALAMAAAANYLRRAGALRGPQAISGNQATLPLGTLAFFGACLGFGVLAKGPAAVILAGGAIGIWAIATSHFRLALRLAHPVSVAAFSIVALPWYVLCARRNPDFIHVFIFQHNFERYLTPLFQHKQPFWFFGPITILALLPWTPFLLAALAEGRRIIRENTWRNSPGFFWACWALFPILFFSLSQSKLPSYILPAIAPLAILVAVSAGSVSAHSRVLSLVISFLVAIIWIILGIGVAEYFMADPQSRLTAELILALAILAAGFSLIFWRTKNLNAFVLTSAFAVAIAVEIAGLSVLPNLDSVISARELARSIAASSQTNLYTYGLQRSWNYGLAFYAGYEIKEWSPENSGSASLLTTAQGLNELKKLGRFTGSANPHERGIRYVRIEPATR